MIGVIQGMYWNHRRMWIQEVNNEIWLAAHTNKNWYGLKERKWFIRINIPYTAEGPKMIKK